MQEFSPPKPFNATRAVAGWCENVRRAHTTNELSSNPAMQKPGQKGHPSLICFCVTGIKHCLIIKAETAR